MSAQIGAGQPNPGSPILDSVPRSSASALAETTATYDLAAHELAASHWQADFGTYLNAFVRLVREGTHPIVDAGCGAGRDVAALVSRGFKCLGVEISSGMLSIARTRVLDRRASWLQADMRAIPLETGGAGGVWTNAALLHLDADGQLAALQEFRRLLLPNRPLFVTTLAGSGWTSRRTATGMRRWFWGTDLGAFSETVESAGFHIDSARAEQGVVRGEWINVLAVAA
jgi:SAM-dependent methyltransferase